MAELEVQYNTTYIKFKKQKCEIYLLWIHSFVVKIKNIHQNDTDRFKEIY